MDSLLSEYLKHIREQKKRRYRLSAMIAALSVAVSCSVSWQLRGIGTAMTNTQPYDEMTEDMIAEAQAAHPPDIQFSLPDLQNECLSERIARIAEAQIGYTENTGDCIPDADGITYHCYSDYGAWYGDPYAEWNTMFTDFCLRQSGADETDIPLGTDCRSWAAELEKSGLMTAPERAAPSRGDIVFLDSSRDGTADRSAIIRDVTDGQTLAVIEGNADGAVAEKEYRTDSECIAGYLSFAAQPPPQSGIPLIREFSAVSAAGITVNVSAPAEAFPQDAVMTVSDVPQEEAMLAAGNLNAAALDAVAVDITFSDADGTVLEPADAQTVQVQITLPSEKRLSSGEFALLHMTESGDVFQIEDAAVTETGAEFEAESFSIYVLVSGSYTEKDQAITVNGQAIPNSEDMPYVVYVGDSFTIKTVAENWTHPEWGRQGYPYGADASILENISQTSVDSENQNGALVVLETTYQAKSAGSTVIHLTEDRNFKSADFYVRVFEKPEIYVKTEFEYKQIDRVKEYLGGYNLYNQDGYVPNALGLEDGMQQAGRPYVVRVGDTFEIYADGIGEFSLTHYDLDIGWNTGYKYHLTETDQPKIKQTEFGTGNEPGTTKAIFEGLAPGEIKITFTTPQGKQRTMWVRVLPKNDLFNHADMEIADGGKYTFSKTEYVNGQKQTTIEVYDALVSYVNQADVCTSDPTAAPLATFLPNNYQKKDDSVTQYELTSAYHGINFKVDEADHVQFDVNIELRPTAIYQMDADGNLTVSRTYTSAESEAAKRTITNMKFDLGQQAIIDAMNKCPMTNGFDFTIRPDAALVNIEAVKELNGGILQEGQFSFELVDEAGNVVSSAVNDKDGNVVFLDQIYTEPGTYTYTIREKETGNPSKLVYDSPKNVTVTISEVCVSDDLTILSASISEMPKFINYVTYRLPETGGTGTIPYTAAGIILIGAALMLLHRKRKTDCE